MSSELSTLQQKLERHTAILTSHTKSSQGSNEGLTSLWFLWPGFNFWLAFPDSELEEFTLLDRFESNDGEIYYGIVEDSNKELHTVSMYDIMVFAVKPQDRAFISYSKQR